MASLKKLPIVSFLAGLMCVSPYLPNKKTLSVIEPASGYENIATPSALKRTVHPLALVYRGPAACEGCAEAVADLLKKSRWNFNVQYVGPNESVKLNATNLRRAALYVQPGGANDQVTAYQQMGDAAANLIHSYVKSGGRYLGICMGGYLAGTSYGFDLLPGDSGEYIITPGASIRSDNDTIVLVSWRGHSRYMYFQDGPDFVIDNHATRVDILARYSNGTIAALVTPSGKGWVAVVGPHPEANQDWYDAYELTNPTGVKFDLGFDLINTLMSEPKRTHNHQ